MPEIKQGFSAFQHPPMVHVGTAKTAQKNRGSRGGSRGQLKQIRGFVCEWVNDSASCYSLKVIYDYYLIVFNDLERPKPRVPVDPRPAEG